MPCTKPGVRRWGRRQRVAKELGFTRTTSPSWNLRWIQTRSSGSWVRLSSVSWSKGKQFSGKWFGFYDLLLKIKHVRLQCQDKLVDDSYIMVGTKQQRRVLMWGMFSSPELKWKSNLMVPWWTSADPVFRTSIVSVFPKPFQDGFHGLYLWHIDMSTKNTKMWTTTSGHVNPPTPCKLATVVLAPPCLGPAQRATLDCLEADVPTRH